MGRNSKLFNGLTSKENFFVQEVLQGKSLVESAKGAGYNIDRSQSYPYLLAKKPHILKAIEQGKKLALQTAVISVSEVVQGLARIAFLDVRDIVDPQTGLTREIKELPEGVAKAITKITKKTRYLKNGDKVTTWEYAFESRKGALDTLSEIAGLTKSPGHDMEPDKIIGSITDLVKAATEYGKAKEVVKVIDAITPAP